MKEALKPKSKPSKMNEKNADARSLGGSRFYTIFDSTSIITFFELNMNNISFRLTLLLQYYHFFQLQFEKPPQAQPC